MYSFSFQKHLFLLNLSFIHCILVLCLKKKLSLRLCNYYDMLLKFPLQRCAIDKSVKPLGWNTEGIKGTVKDVQHPACYHPSNM